MGEWTQPPPLGFPLCAIVSEAITTSSLSSSPILSGATQLTVPAVIRPKGCDTHATDCTINRLCMLIGLCWTMFVTCAIIIPLGGSWTYNLVSRNHIRCCSSAAKIKSSAIFQWIRAAEAATYRESSVHLRRSDPRILLLFSGAPWNYAPMFCLFVIGDTQQNTNAHRHIHGATTRRESEAPSERELDFREHELDTRERLRKNRWTWNRSLIHTSSSVGREPSDCAEDQEILLELFFHRNIQQNSLFVVCDTLWVREIVERNRNEK